jgi:hypothetical protein
VTGPQNKIFIKKQLTLLYMHGAFPAISGVSSDHQVDVYVHKKVIFFQGFKTKLNVYVLGCNLAHAQ